MKKNNVDNMFQCNGSFVIYAFPHVSALCGKEKFQTVDPTKITLTMKTRLSRNFLSLMLSFPNLSADPNTPLEC